MVPRVYSKAFRKAAELAGGPQELARHLRVPLDELEGWMAGAGVPPTPVFLQVIDLVLDRTPSPGMLEGC